MLEALLCLHRQDFHETIKLFHVEIAALLSAVHQLLNWLIKPIYGGHFGFMTTFPNVKTIIFLNHVLFISYTETKIITKHRSNVSIVEQPYSTLIKFVIG